MQEIPQQVYEAIKQKLIDIRNRLDAIKTLITNVPDLLLNGIKSIFVPDQESLKGDVLGLVDSVSHSFNLAIDSEQWLVDSFAEKPLSNETGKYYISGVGEFNLTFFDTTFLVRGVEYFRPIIRGFIVLLLCFFHYKQVLTFIGQDPGMYSNAHTTYMEHKEGGK